MSELNNNKISDEALENVTGGNDGYGEGTYSVRDITPIWVEVTSSSLNHMSESATDTSTRLIQEGFPKQIAYKQSGYPKKAAAPEIISGAAAFF